MQLCILTLMTSTANDCTGTESGVHGMAIVDTQQHACQSTEASIAVTPFLPSPQAIDTESSSSTPHKPHSLDAEIKQTPHKHP
jgi:hypothetical protein